MTRLDLSPDRTISLTVLYDARCSLCRTIAGWLAALPHLVPMDFVPASSQTARERFPFFDHDQSMDEITVISDAGTVYLGEQAWIAALWATRTHRALAMRLSRPGMQRFVRVAAYAAAGVREWGTSGRDASGPEAELPAGSDAPG
ncbi:MAG: thiol-disulfide oxidoreductase DCC family protein [Nocardioides sp.]